MTENDYAAHIYCQVFSVTTDNGDAYARGILDAISTLDDWEQAALEWRFRYGKTFKRTGEIIGGVTGEAASRIVRKALVKLRHPSVSYNMSVSEIIKHRETLLEGLKIKIGELYDQLERSAHGYPIDPDIRNEMDIRKMSVGELGLSARAYNHLMEYGIDTVESLLRLDSLDSLSRMRGFGRRSRNDIIMKMREKGHIEWADRMESKSQPR